MEHLVGELFDFFRKSGREQQALPLCGQQFDDTCDIGDKAHVKHAVGFVKDQRLYLAKIQAFLLDQIEQAARGGDKHFDAAADFFDLRFDVDTAESA